MRKSVGTLTREVVVEVERSRPGILRTHYPQKLVKWRAKDAEESSIASFNKYRTFG